MHDGPPPTAHAMPSSRWSCAAIECPEISTAIDSAQLRAVYAHCGDVTGGGRSPVAAPAQTTALRPAAATLNERGRGERAAASGNEPAPANAGRQNRSETSAARRR